MKIECPRLAENASVASLNADKRRVSTGRKGKGVINEGNRLIIDVFQCMFAHSSLISVNYIIYASFLSIKILNCVTFFFQCMTAYFFLQMRDNHTRCVILRRSKVCICCHSNNCSMATKLFVSFLAHYICKPNLIFSRSINYT